MKFLRNILILAVAVFAVSACDTTKIEDAIDNFGIVIGLEAINTSAAVLITDASTGELVNATVETEFTGPNGSDIVDIYSDPLLKVNVKGGILNFGINNEVVPTADQPATVKLRLSSPGYNTTTHTVSITNTGGSDFAVSLVNESNPPAGITFKASTVGTASSNGTTNQEIIVEVSNTDSQTNQESGVEVIIPSGSVLVGANGSALTGSLTASSSYYNAGETEAVKAIPEELFTNINDSVVVMLGASELLITDSNGNEATGFGTTAGKMGVDEVASQEYVLAYTLDQLTYNELKDFVKLLAYDPVTAERTVIQAVPDISSLPDGKVQLSYLIKDQLFRYSMLSYLSNVPCNATIAVTRNGNQGKIPITISDRGFRRTSDLAAASSQLTVNNLFNGLKDVTAVLPSGNYTQQINICAEASPTLILPTAPTNIIDATINVTLSCANNDEKVGVTDIPSASVLYRMENAPLGTPWRVATDLDWNYNSTIQALEGASCKIAAVEQGKRYNLKITYDGNIEETTILIDGPVVAYTEVIDADICN